MVIEEVGGVVCENKRRGGFGMQNGKPCGVGLVLVWGAQLQMQGILHVGNEGYMLLLGWCTPAMVGELSKPVSPTTKK